MLNRCGWCLKEEIYIKYHDDEWGVPTYDDKRIFEFVVLESAQAGLSWITILKKREKYREALNDFDPYIIAKYTDEDVKRLMDTEGIIRNRRKIEAAVNNAKAFLRIQEEFGSFSSYMWGFVDGKAVVNKWVNIADVPASTTLSDIMSDDLKKRGFKFFGTVICYSFLQALGVVNDHIVDCFRYNEINTVNNYIC